MGENRHNPAGRGLGELPRVDLEARVLRAERQVGELRVAFRDLSERYRVLLVERDGLLVELRRLGGGA